MSLNPDQLKASEDVAKWWKSKSLYHIVDGAGGTGKSFLLDEALKGLKGVSPVILAPTNEALKNIREKVKGDYIFKTVDSALGIAPTTHEEELSFEQIALPPFWDDINLACIDEASMIDDFKLTILKDIGVKILNLGHKSQLPPVKQQRSVLDKCISPVFEQGWSASTLTIPMRNTGKLWEFNNELEQLIYEEERNFPRTYDCKQSDIQSYMASSQGIEDFHSNKTKIIAWSNNAVNKQNKAIRQILFGDYAKNNKYLPTDKIIITQPLTYIGLLETYNEKKLRLLSQNKEWLVLHANTKGTVLSSSKVTIKINDKHVLQCYKIVVQCEDEILELYEPLYMEQLHELDNYYKHIAWSKARPEAKRKAFKERYFVTSLFAHIKHFYAATTYRMQGSSIENVILVNHDIAKCPNLIEQKKHRYVAASRTINNLMIDRG